MNDEFVFVRAMWNYDRDAASLDAGLDCQDPTRAQQQFRDECDINTIVERFGITGQMPEQVATPMTGDFTEVVDYQTALDMLRQADEAFLTIPAEVRAQFDNDAGKFVTFVSDPANAEAMKELKLPRIVPPPPPAPISVVVVPTPTPPAPGAS